MWVEVRNRKGAVALLGVFYRPPNSNRDTEEQIGRQILERCRSNRVVVMGDFNFPNIDWNLLSANSLDGADFVRCVQEGFLTQYVDSLPSSQPMLDLVFGNEPGQVADLSVGEHFGDGDHNSLTFTRVMERDRSRRDGKIFNWGRGNYNAIRQELGSLNWEQMFSGKCTTGMRRLFREHLLRLLDRFVPMRQGRDGKVKEPWMTRDVEQLVKRKKEAYLRLRKQGSDRALEGYKVARKELKNGLRRARRGHEKVLAGRIKENPKAFYTYVRNKRMTRVRVGPIRDSGGNLCLESEEVGEVLNEYFASVFTSERDLVVCEDSVKQADMLEQVDVKEDVLEILKDMRIDKSPGPDGIYPRLLREAREEIAAPLAMIFASSLSTGVVPDDWRVANVVPLFKKGNRDNLGITDQSVLRRWWANYWRGFCETGFMIIWKRIV
ncbi:uncharacterized protein [Heterodontus francisci]|uniref:uncharacterized protein n=1 Tax=Heterodontus francisci TaxID=7792 RepID=UPI00355B856A